MKITPQHAELIMEAVQLREFGWTQQQIADDLKEKQYTISRSLKKWHNGTSDNGHKTGRNMQNERYDSMPESHSIRLFPCLYEEAAQRIEPGSIDLILTDPPYLASSADMDKALGLIGVTVALSRAWKKKDSGNSKEKT